MPRLFRLTHRLLLLWFASVAAVLGVSGVAFLMFEEHEIETERRARIEAAFAVLQNHVDQRATLLGRSAATMANRPGVVATIGLYANYFDPEADNAAVFDTPARELAMELGELARAAGASWASVIGPHGPVSAYWRHGDEDHKAYFSLRPQSAEVYVSTGAGVPFRAIDQQASFIARVTAVAGADVGDATVVTACATAGGPALVVRRPIQVDAQQGSREFGQVILGACLDEAFVDKVAAQAGAAFGIVGERKLFSDAMPDIIPPAMAEPLASPAQRGGLTLAGMRWHSDEVHVLGAGDWLLGDGSRNTAMFVLSRQQLSEQRSALFTAGLAGMGLAATVVFVVGLLYLRRNVTSPLERLVAAVASLRAGHYETVAGVRPGDEIGDLVHTFNTMTEQIRERESELRRLSLAVEQSPASVIITSPDAKIEYVNPRFSEITGYTAAEVIGQDPGFLKSGHMPEDVYRELWDTIRAGKVWRGELSNRTKDGRVVHEQTSISPIFDDKGEIAHFVAVKEDITRRKEAEAYVNHLAYHDALTDLPNRRLFRDRLSQALRQHQRNGGKFALLILDLDHFKDINDSLGHTVGDELLRLVAGRLSGLVREADTLARLGGDEFAILQSGIRQPSDAAVLAQKIIDSFRESFELGLMRLHSNTSVGIAVPTGDVVDVDDMISRADIALYKAKAAGRAGYVYFDDAMTAQVQNDAELVHDLARALQLGQLSLAFQPQVELASGRLVGVESLLRWQHPQLGNIPPIRFIPLAESRGLMPEIGLWVMAESCRQWKRWRDEGLDVGRVAVNVSAVQFKGGRGFESMLETIERSGVPPDVLEIEFTESAFVDVGSDTLAWIRNLSERGVHFAIDDFGTGYSSLIMLRQLRAHKLKIDREFVKDMLADPNDAAIVHATVSLAKTLGMTVVAEGIEEAAQADYLRGIGCDVGQGYHFARPMSAEDILTRYRPA
ncbi:EAL domain-containing protein [Thauera sp. CAU 1555]|uniref:EAL domain-containing protein n=1 Tax=Thauera sedimentorum TaxID=2767595 RepID=A0ABR9B7U0_9RHOO|nr:EAL domain-containing protein [Thauera sedimentorum]MBC9071500.1 EAL domain-containing protein [Thauera sedimentorum]MBD8502419.1 EAL domain-containing protein [Thauera sedimentorum]